LPGISIPEQLSGKDRLNEAASLTSCPEATFDVAYHRCLVAHYRHDADGNKSGKSKGTCTGLGQINAAAFNIGPSVRDRDRDGMAILLVVTLTLEPKGSDLCAAVMTLSSRGMPLAVLVPGCDESPMAYSDATQSSARTGMLSKQNTSAAINRRMRDPKFTSLDALAAS
jgi:hypothetical protein